MNKALHLWGFFIYRLTTLNYPMPIERKLAAIMFTDIAGYTAQMSKDQDVAFTLLEEKQNVFRPLVKEHNGTLIKEMGEG